MAAENINIPRGDLIKELRLKKGWTQQELGEKIKKSVGAISKFEQGESFTLATAQSLAKALGVALQKLIEPTSVQDDYLVVPHHGKDAEESSSSYGKFNANMSQGTFMLVPFVNQYAYGGYTSGFADEEYLDSLPTWPFPVDDREYKGTYRAFEVRGESMDDGTSSTSRKH